MNLDQVAAAVTSRTKAIMVVHIYGHPVDMDPIMAIAARHGLVVIEDAAEVHGVNGGEDTDGAAAHGAELADLDGVPCRYRQCPDVRRQG